MRGRKTRSQAACATSRIVRSERAMDLWWSALASSDAERTGPCFLKSARGTSSAVQPSRTAMRRSAHSPLRPASAIRSACFEIIGQRPRSLGTTWSRRNPRAVVSLELLESSRQVTAQCWQSFSSALRSIDKRGRASRIGFLGVARRTHGIAAIPRGPAPRPMRIKMVSSTSSLWCARRIHWQPACSATCTSAAWRTRRAATASPPWPQAGWTSTRKNGTPRRSQSPAQCSTSASACGRR